MRERKFKFLLQEHQQIMTVLGVMMIMRMKNKVEKRNRIASRRSLLPLPREGEKRIDFEYLTINWKENM